MYIRIALVNPYSCDGQISTVIYIFIMLLLNQCFGSVTFWYTDPDPRTRNHFLTDKDSNPATDPDPAFCQWLTRCQNNNFLQKSYYLIDS
jgi:hypothetical protein